MLVFWIFSLLSGLPDNYRSQLHIQIASADRTCRLKLVKGSGERALNVGKYICGKILRYTIASPASKLSLLSIQPFVEIIILKVL